MTEPAGMATVNFFLTSLGLEYFLRILPKSEIMIYYLYCLMMKDEMTMNIKEFNIEVILGECESIISATENILELYEEEGLNDIREIAEYLQKMSIKFIDNKITFDELNDITIELYQNIKYTIDYIDEEYSDYDFYDLVTIDCNDMRNSINEIRSFFVTESLL